MVGDGADAALGSTAVRKDTDIGRGEIGADASVRDVFQTCVDTGLQVPFPDDFFVFVVTAVGFSGDDELVAVVELAEGFQQDVQSFVVPDQSEEKQGAFVGINAELLTGLCRIHPLAEMGVERVGGDDGPGCRVQVF